MNKGKAARLLGFVGALGLSTALVTTAVQGTGAYFEDSVGGNLYASSGSLQISTVGQTISFKGLNPGEDRTQDIVATNKSTSTTPADIWLVFDTTLPAYSKFTGPSSNSDGGGLGQYGHFKVDAPAGYFESYNLSLKQMSDATGGYTNTATYKDTGVVNTCMVDKWGHFGSAAQHHAANVGNDRYDIALCGVPGAILLDQNVAAGDTSTTTITFGLTGKQDAQNQANDPNVPFTIVATQPGVFPGQAWGTN